MNKNVISVIDGEAGSCGKAKVVGEIATDRSIKLGASITNCMPNAGHTFVSARGKRIVFRNIPVSIVNPKTELFIGPGSAIDMSVFKEEYSVARQYLNGRKIYVHEMVPLIEQRHKDKERREIKSGSTFKGCGAVTQDKVIRDKDLKFFETYYNAVRVSNDEWLERVHAHLDNAHEYVLLEGAQGCDLDLNHSGNYPHVTSRNVSSAQLLADSGISPERLLETIMVVRPFPIRISNITKDGEYIYTGEYGEGAPLTWTQINLASMYGGYPFPGDVETYYGDAVINIEYMKKLIRQTNPIYLMQLFGENFRGKKLESITLLEALELERLMYKSKGINGYETKIISLPDPLCDKTMGENYVVDQSEQTSVTKMERRVFDLDIKKLKNNVRINTPYGLYLNFFQHLDYEFAGHIGKFEDCWFDRYVENYLDWLEDETGVPILALGTGEVNGERIIKKSLYRK